MNNFGGGFDGLGASQFAGGGFMPSPAGANVGGFGGGGENKKSNGLQTLRAVTIRQIFRDNNADDDQFKVDNIEITTITVVGKILSVQEHATRTLLTIDDGTGTMEVMQWMNDTDSDTLNQMKEDWRVGAYVRVYGNLRTFERKKSMVAYSIKPVHDYNEVTYHFLQCVFQHLHLTKGAPPAAGAAPSPMGFGAKPAFQQQQQGGNNYTPGGTAVASAPGGGGGGVNEDLMAVYHQPDIMSRDSGISNDDVIQALKARGAPYTAQTILQAIQFLTNEGNLYSTVDENHHKSTATF